MSDLDKKLLEFVLGEDPDNIEPLDVRQLRIKKAEPRIAEIKQALADAGYVHVPGVKPGDYITINAGTAILNGDGTVTQVVRMTGPEWYEKAATEVDKTFNLKANRAYIKSIDALAKKYNLQ